MVQPGFRRRYSSSCDAAGICQVRIRLYRNQYTRLLPTAAEYEEKSSHVVWIVAFKRYYGGALESSVNMRWGERKQIPENLGMLGEDALVNAEGCIFGSGDCYDAAVWKPDFCVLYKLT